MDSVTAAAAGGGAACATCNHHHEEEDAEAVSKLNQKALHMASSRRSEEDLAGASSSASSCSSVEEERVEALKVAVSTILEAVGEDPTRDGLLDTPERFAKALLYLTKGYRMSAEAEVGSALFEEDTSGELVVVKNIEFHSLCEHHMLPFHGRVTIGYLPEGRVLGLSKLARITEVYARRLQIQEKMSRQIAEAVEQLARPRGVGVIIDAEHMCMSMRGVEKCQSSTVTVFTTGALRSDRELRREFFTLAGHHS